MSKKYIASYDFGTSSVKAVLVGEDGRVLKHATSPYPLIVPKSGWAEQDPKAYWAAVCKATKEAMAAAAIPAEDVIGVVFGTMWKGIIPISKEGEPLRNCIIWLDARGEKQAKQLNERLHTSRFCAQDYWARLMWLRDEEPEIYEKAEYILENNSYLKFRATGKLGIDLCNCFVTSTKPEIKKEYEEIMAATGLDMKKFPPCVMPWDEVGQLTENAAEEMGLHAGTPVFGGGGDIPAIATGSGAGTMYAAHIYLGSSGWLGLTMPGRDPAVGETYSSLDNEKEVLIYGMQSACMAFDWTLRCFYKTEWENLGGKVYALVEGEQEKIPAGSDGLLATPWLFGERLPLSEKARGLFFNINATHTRAHFVNAMQESICFMLRSNLECYHKKSGRRIEKLRVVGGATGSNHWMQMLADILDVTVEVPADSRHAGAIGTAYSALIGLKKCANFEEVNKIIHVEKSFAPQKDKQAIYEKNYRAFSALYPALKNLYEEMNG